MRADRIACTCLWILIAVLAIGAVTAVVREKQMQRVESARYAHWMTGGDPNRGEVMIRSYGCGACHQIPGIAGARGRVGPSLKGIASRTYIAGKFPQSPQNLVDWIQHPQVMDPGVDMPEMGVKDRDAGDIAAYLYTLK